MAFKGQSLRNRVIPPQLPQPRRGRGGRPPTSRIVPVLLCNDEDTKNEKVPIARGSLTEGAGAAHTDTQVNFTAEGPMQEVESSAGTTEA
jgi:hypothetical protein